MFGDGNVKDMRVGFMGLRNGRCSRRWFCIAERSATLSPRSAYVVKRSVDSTTCQQNASTSRSGAPAVATLCGLPSLR